jgi:hypothetical protein
MSTLFDFCSLSPVIFLLTPETFEPLIPMPATCKGELVTLNLLKPRQIKPENDNSEPLEDDSGRKTTSLK